MTPALRQVLFGASRWGPSTAGARLLYDMDPNDLGYTHVTGGLIDSIDSKGAITEALVGSGGFRFTWTANDLNGKATMVGNNKIMNTANNITLDPSTVFVGLVMNTAAMTTYHGIMGINLASTSGYGIQRAGATQSGWTAGDFTGFGGGGYDGTNPPRLITNGAAGLGDGAWHAYGFEDGLANSLTLDGSLFTLRAAGGESATGDCPSVTNKLTVGGGNIFDASVFDLRIARMIIIAEPTAADKAGWAAFTKRTYGV